MNHYPDNYHGYGRDAPNMQGMAYGYRESSAMRGHPTPDYHGGYPMGAHQGGAAARGMYGQARAGPYGMTNYSHYNSSGYMGHHHGMVNPYYGSHGQQMPGSVEGYNMHQAQHMGMAGAGHPRHPSMMGSNGGGQSCTSPASQDPYGSAYAGQGSPTRMHLQQQGHSSHPQVPVPQHPMRQTNAQQNPQEVADNILQMASAYPSNQTVQVPLKNRPAPYHIPRSPHYVPRQDYPQHTSPGPQQHQQVMSSHACASPTSGVKSPLSQNPTPSPGPGMLRSPSGQVMSPCGSQRSPSSHSGSAYSNQAAVQPSQMANMSPVPHGAAATHSSQPQQYHGHQHHHSHPPHNSHLVHQSDSPHYSPCSNMVQSPYSASPSAQVQAAPYSPHNPNQSSVQAHQYHHPGANIGMNPPSSNMSAPYVSTSPNSVGPASSYAQTSSQSSNNPLMSLEKLVMLPETQVVDPKSVVNDACLSTQSDEGPKNVEDPAERSTESLGHSVGSSGFSSSLPSQAVDTVSFAESVLETAAGSLVSQPEKVVTATNTQASLNLSQLPTFDGIETTNMAAGDESVSPPTCPNDAFQGSDFNQTNKSMTDLLQADTQKNVHQVAEAETEVIERKDDLCTKSFAVEQNHAGNIEKHDFHRSPKASENNSIPLNNSQSQENTDHSCVDSEAIETNSPLISNSIKSCNVISGADLELKPPPKSGIEWNSKIQNLKEISPKSESTSQEHYKLTNSDYKLLSKDDETSEDISISSEVESNESTKILDPSALTLSKFVSAKEQLKLSPVPCHPPSVLSEVPIILNGVENGTSCEMGEDPELNCGNNILSKVHNGLNTLVKSKLGYSRRSSLLSRITPCSIAVDASERAACERFSLRRNGLGRVTHTPSNRERNNSSGNADSDESLENISSSSLLTSRDPQDGTRKRGPSSSKRNGFNKSVVSSFTKNTDSTSGTAKVPLDNNACVPHGTTTAGSEEEACYYEGVDSTYDVYLNTFSSDESGLSDDRGSKDKSKQQKRLKSNSEVEETKDDSVETSTLSKKEDPCGDDESVEAVLTQKDCAEDKKSESSMTPPNKRLKSSFSPTADSDRTSYNIRVSPESKEVIDLTLETVSPVLKKGSPSPRKQGLHGVEKFRPSILSRRPLKYPVVVLEKSPIISPKLVQIKKESSDLNVSEGSTPQQLTCANLPDVKTESISCSDINNSAAVAVHFDCHTPEKKMDVKEEAKDVLTNPNTINSPKKNSPKKKPTKRKAAKSKGKGKETFSSRQSDVTDSFKSMKFGYTLDLMKANRKREGGGIGPFVRISGQRSSPKTVSVFAQPTAEVLAAAKQGKTGSANKKGQSLAAPTTVRVVSNFESKQTPMVPSSRTVSQKPWVCAFCGHQSSYKFLGDLFGPYFKESELSQVEKLSAKESKGADPDKNVKPPDLGKKTGKGHPQGTSAVATKPHRRKLTLQPRTTELPAPVPEEIWVHQACALWSPGVCLVGNKIYGLDEAVKDAAENICSECKSAGAMIGCLHKGCSMKYHFVCAVEKDCYMMEENLSSLCPKHKAKKLGSASTSKS